MSSYEVLVLGGGATKGLIVLGALQALHDANLLRGVKKYYGTSVGTMISYLLAIGYTPVEVLIYLTTHDVTQKLQNMSLMSAFKNEGAIQYTPIQEALEEMTMLKLGCKQVTLQELHDKYGKDLIVCTYNLSRSAPEYIDRTTCPDLPCLTAIRMSSNIPLVFPRFKHEGCYYLDGAIFDNFPIVFAKTREGSDTKIIGLPMLKVHSSITDATNVLEYMLRVMYIPVEEIIMRDCLSCVHDSNVALLQLEDSFTISLTSFNVSANEKFDMFSAGYAQGNKWCVNNRS